MVLFTSWLQRLGIVAVLIGSLPVQAGTVLVLGDSLGAAFGLPREQGWVQLLQEQLQAEGYDYDVVNASVSGDTTRGGLARLQRLLPQVQPDICVLELGGNDGLRGFPLRLTENNLQTMIDLCREQGARVMLVGIMLPPNYGPAYAEAFRAIYGRLAERNQVPLVPFLLEGVIGRDGWMQADGIHPTALAQPTMRDNVWVVLQPLLETS